MVHGSRGGAGSRRLAQATLTGARPRSLIGLGLVLASLTVACGDARPVTSPTVPGEVVRRFVAVLSEAPSAPLDLQLLAEEVDASLAVLGLADDTTVTRTVDGLVVQSTAAHPALAAALATVLEAPGPARLLDPGGGEVAEDRPIDPTWRPLVVGAWVDPTSVAVTTDPRDQRTVVHLRLVPDAARIFSDWTATHVGATFVVDVAGRIASAPTLNEAIPSDELLIVTVSEEAAIRLAAALRATGGLTFVERAA